MGNRASLNHVYRTIWNQSLGAMVAVAEIAPSQGGGSAPGGGHLQPLPTPQDVVARIGTLALSIALVWGVTAPLVQANPTGAAAIVGSANLATQGNKLTVTTQNGVGLQHSAINWQSFSVPAGNTTHFQQPSAASTVINRVVTNVPSQLFGTLSSNGHLVLVNQAGIAVGAGALVDTAGFTASALRMTDADALAGRLRFGDATVSTTGVSVQGRILARSGDAVLIGSSLDVGQDALIQAPNGSTLLAAGQQVEVTGRGLEGISFQLQAPTDQALNLGKLSGNAVGIFAGTLKHSGQIRADAVTVEGGKVVLKASRQLDVAGQVSAQALNQRGGTIQATAPEVLVRASAVLDASGATGGGELLLGGGYQGKDARLSNAQTTTVEMGAQLRADATTQGDGGTVIVWADDTTRVHGSVSARGGPQGGDGGFIETSGKRLLDVTQAADASAPLGKAGAWLLDPYNVTIVDPALLQPNLTGTLDGSGLSFGPVADSSTISNAVINAALDAGTSVAVSTGSGGTQLGDITVASAITKSSGGDATLTLTAQNNINLNSDIVSNNNMLNLDIQATTGSIEQPLGRQLVTRGGTVSFTSGGATTVRGFIDTRGADSLAGAGGTGGSVSIISAGDITLNKIDASGGGAIGQFYGGYAGTVTVRAAGNVLVTGVGAGIWAKGGTQTNSGQLGWGGWIDLKAGQDQSYDPSSTGGNVTLNNATIDATGQSSAQVSITASEGGTTQSLGLVILNSGTTITAGSVDINAANHLQIDGANLTAVGGGVNLRAGWVPISELGPAASTQGGNLTLADTQIISSGSVSLQAYENGSGAYGNLAVQSGSSITATSSTNEISMIAAGDLGVSDSDLTADINITLRAGYSAVNLAASLTGGGMVLTNANTNAANIDLWTTEGSLGAGAIAITGSHILPTNGFNATAAGDLVVTSSSLGLVGTSSVNLEAGYDESKSAVSAQGGNLSLTASTLTGGVTVNLYANEGTGSLSNGHITLAASTAGPPTQTSISAGDLLVMAAGNLTVANSSLSATGYLDLTAGWDDWIGASSTQGGNLALSGTTQITAVDSVNLAAYASGALARGEISLAGSITAPFIYVTAESNLTQSQSAALVMLGYSELSVTGGDIILSESDNHFTTVNVTATKINGYGGVVSLSNAYPLVLAGVTAESLTLLTTAGDVTQASGGNASIVVSGATSVTSLGGNVTLTNPNNNFSTIAVAATGYGGSVALVDTNALELGAITAAGLTATVSGDLTQAPGTAIVTSSASLTANDLAGNGGNIALANSGNNFGSVAAMATQYSGYGGAVFGGAVSLANSGGPLVLGTIAAYGGLVVSAGGNLTQSAAISAGGVISLTATGGHDITLNNSGNNFDTTSVVAATALPVSGVGGAVTLTAANALKLGNVESKSLTLNAGGTINQSAGSSLSTGTFTLSSGNWNQVIGPLPSFSATDFRIVGGSFLRVSGGYGTPQDPYLLTDVYGLQGMGSSTQWLGSAYALANNIDATGTAGWNLGAGFKPVGAYGATPFSGSFDGQGNTITGLTINRPSTDGVGLFGQTGAGAFSQVIQKVGLLGGSVTGQNMVGGLIGYNFNNSGVINKSFNTGAVAGVTWVGGLIGDNRGTVNNSFATGRVMGGHGGGLVGLNYSAATISNSYATGYVASGGGFVYSNIGAINNSYWNTETSGRTLGSSVDTPAGTAGLTTAALQGVLPSGLWDSNTWGTSSGLYPYLRAFNTTAPQAVTGFAKQGDGSTAAAAAQISLYSGGSTLPGAATSTGANGYYYSLLPGGSVTASSALGATLALAGGNAETGVAYSDSRTLVDGNVSGVDLTAGLFRASTAQTTYSALQSDLSANIGAGKLATIKTAMNSGAQTITASTAFSLDQTPWSIGALSLTSLGGHLSLDTPMSLSSASGITLNAWNNLNINAPLAVSGNNGLALLYGQSGTSSQINGSSSLNMSGSGHLQIAGTGNTTFSGNLSGSVSLTKAGTGTVTLDVASTATGITTISAGTLAVAVTGSLADTTAVVVGATGTYAVSASDTIGSVSGAGTVTLGYGATLTAGGDNTSTTLSGGMSGTGNLTKVGTGALTLSGTNTVGGLTLSAGTLGGGSSGSLTVSNAFSQTGGTFSPSGNAFSSINITQASGDLTVGSLTTGQLDLAAVTGNIAQTSGSVINAGATNLFTGGGNVALNQPDNDFYGAVSVSRYGVHSGNVGAVSLQDSNGLMLGTVRATTLDVIARGGNIAQTGYGGSVTVSGASSFAATGGDIMLAEPNNDFGSVAATATLSAGYGGSVSLTDLNTLSLDNVTSTGLTVATGSDLVQAVGTAVTVSGATSLSSGTGGYGGTVTLNQSLNNFNTVALSAAYGGAVSLADTNALTITNLTTAAIQQNQAISLVAGGPLVLPTGPLNTGTANLTLSSGDTLITPGNLSGTNVALTGTTGLTLAHNVTATGTLNLSAAISGGITQSSGAISAIGITTVQAGGAGAVSLNQANNNFTSVAVNAAGSTVTVTDIGPVVLGTTVAGSLTVNAGGSITQSGAIAVTGASAFTATDSGDITLNNAANNFNSLSLTADSANGGAISVTDENALTINSIVARGDITVTAGGNMVLAGLVRAPRTASGGTVQLTATAGAITKTGPAGALDVEGKSIHLTAATGIGTNALPIKVYEDSWPVTASLHFSNTISSGVFISSDQPLHVDEGHNDGGPITLSSNADLEIIGALTASGSINLSAAGEMVVNAHQFSTVEKFSVNASKFTLNSGTWRQVAANLPAFDVTDFRIAGGTFIRALGGDGNVGTPYRLTDAYGLQGVGSAYMLDQSYVLANNIDASGTSAWRSGNGFVPIGVDTWFTGSLNGQGHTIQQLKVVWWDNTGLFAAVGDGGQVRNLGLIDPKISGISNVGALAGRNGGLISGSFALSSQPGSAYVTGTGSGVGGLVGRNDAPGQLSQVQLGHIEDSHAAVPATGLGDVGGLVGYNASGFVYASYAVGSVAQLGQGARAGGLVGYGGTVTSSFWNTETTFQAQSDGGVGLNSAEMKQLARYAGWNISGSGGSSSIWRIYEGQTAPLLRSFLTPLDVTAGNGTRVYDGTTDFAGSLSYSQTPDPTGVLGAPSYVLSSKNVGTQVVTPAGLYSHQLGYDIRAVGGQAVVTPKALSVSYSGVNKTYDGSTTASVTTSDNRITNDDLSINRTASFLDKNAGSAKAVNVSAVSLVGTDAQNYTVAASGSTTADIDKAALSVSYSGVNKTYDGSTTASVTTSDNRIGNDDLSINRTASFTDKNAGSAKTVNVSGVSLVGTDAQNYAVAASGSTTADIAKAALSATANAAGKTYDGNTTASMSLSGLSGLVGTETLGVSAAGSFDTKNAGTGKTVTVNSVALQDGANGGLANNYQLASGQTATADIARATLSVSGSSAADKTYDGTSTAAIATGTLSGLIGSEKVSASASGNFDSKNAGARTATATYSLGDDSVTGGLASNYTLSDNSLLSATISPKALSVSGSTAADKTYDGTSTAAIATGTLSGLIGSEKVSASASGTFDSKNAGARTATATYSLGDDSVTGGLAGNYTLSDNSLLSATISPKALSGSVVVAGKTYDASTAANISSRSLSGVIGVEDVSYVGGVASFADKNAGLAKVVTATGLSLAGADAGNYSVNSSASTTAAISKANLTVSSTAVSKTYDGSLSAAGTAVVSAGTLFSGDTLSGGSFAFTDKNAGTGKTVTVAGVTLNDGNNGDNYTLSYASNTASSISPKVLSATANAAGKTYDGTATASVSLSGLIGLVGTETLSVSAAGSFDTKNAGTGKTVTVNTVALQDGANGGLANNYQLASGQTATADIARATLSVSGSTAADKTYDGTSTAAITAGTLSGFIGAEKVSASASGNFDSKNAGARTATATYSLGDDSVTGGLATNYILSDNSLLSATITPRAVSTWIAGTTGAWSNPANWDAIPDRANVLDVTIPAGVTVQFDSDAGVTQLRSLTSAGALNLTGGSLAVANSLSTPIYSQTGGTLSGTGALMVSTSFSQSGGIIDLGGAVDITQLTGNLNVGAISAGSIRLAAQNGAISQTGALVTAGLLATQAAGSTVLTDAGNRVSALSANSTGDLVFTNTGLLDVRGLLSSLGNIVIDNTGGISSSGAVAAPSGAIALTANSPLTVGTAGVQALGDVNLTATDLTSAGNITLNGSIVSTSGSVIMAAANNLVQNSAISAALVVSGSAGLAGSGGAVSFGAGATTDAKSVSYLLNGLAVTAPPQLTKPVVVAPANFVTAFLEVFEKALSEPVEVAAPAAAAKSSTADTEPDGKGSAADAEGTGEKTTDAAKEKAKEKEKEKEKEKTEVVIGGNACTPG